MLRLRWGQGRRGHLCFPGYHPAGWGAGGARGSSRRSCACLVGTPGQGSWSTNASSLHCGSAQSVPLGAARALLPRPSVGGPAAPGPALSHGLTSPSSPEVVPHPPPRSPVQADAPPVVSTLLRQEPCPPLRHTPSSRDRMDLVRLSGCSDLASCILIFS